MNSCFSSFAAPPLWRCGSCAWTRQHLPFLGLRRQIPGHISLSKTIKENRSVFRKITLKKISFWKDTEEILAWEEHYWDTGEIDSCLVVGILTATKRKSALNSFEFFVNLNCFYELSIKPSNTTNFRVTNLILSLRKNLKIPSIWCFSDVDF